MDAMTKAQREKTGRKMGENRRWRGVDGGTEF